MKKIGILVIAFVLILSTAFIFAGGAKEQAGGVEKYAFVFKNTGNPY